MIITDSRIIKIADKYEDKIRVEFGAYVNFDKVDDMKTNIYILSEEECIDKHEDLLNKQGKCEPLTGFIYIRKDPFDQSVEHMQERIIVHEYIHRISRNYKMGEWFLGISSSLNFETVGLNECLTEWYCCKITGIDSGNLGVTYSNGFLYLKKLEAILGTAELENIYFKSNIASLQNILTTEYNKFCLAFSIIVIPEIMFQHFNEINQWYFYLSNTLKELGQ